MDVIESVGVAIADVAGVEPAASERLFGRRGAVPILLHHDAAADRDLADLALVEFVPLAIEDRHCGARPGFAA